MNYVFYVTYYFGKVTSKKERKKETPPPPPHHHHSSADYFPRLTLISYTKGCNAYLYGHPVYVLVTSKKLYIAKKEAKRREERENTTVLQYI
jgi:hypothetical protein